MAGRSRRGRLTGSLLAPRRASFSLCTLFLLGPDVQWTWHGTKLVEGRHQPQPFPTASKALCPACLGASPYRPSRTGGGHGAPAMTLSTSSTVRGTSTIVSAPSAVTTTSSSMRTPPMPCGRRVGCVLVWRERAAPAQRAPQSAAQGLAKGVPPLPHPPTHTMNALMRSSTKNRPRAGSCSAGSNSAGEK